MMRAFTVMPPWAYAIALDHPEAKRTENRRRRTSYRGPIAIHAGKTEDVDAWYGRLGRLLRRMLPARHGARGAIVALAELVDCHAAAACCAPWGEDEPGVWHWSLDDVRVLPEPVPCRGSQATPWYVPEDVERAVRAQLAGAVAS